MSIQVNWADVSLGLIVMAVAFIAAGGYYLVDRARVAAEERRQRSAFEKEMAAARMPAWDGGTYEWKQETEAQYPARHAAPTPAAGYDWDEATLAYLADPYASTAPQHVPDSEISGPLPVMTREPVPADRAFDDEAARWIERMKAENEAWKARMGIR